MSDLQTGTVVGEYVTDGVLARTALSTLYRASHPVIGKRAVIKVPSREHHARTQERFVREARAVNRIRHPNVVDIFGFGTLEDGRSYLTMEHLEGETLAARLHRFRFSHTEAHEVLLQLSDVIDAAHAVGVLHLDLKPDNIFLVPVHGARILVKVLDFGIAAVMDDPSSLNPGGFRGTPEYASPEQAQAHAEIGPASDVYSMGCIAFEMLVGQKPFAGETIMDTLAKQIREPPRCPSSLSPTLTKHEDALVLDMLQKRPTDRPKPYEIRERILVLRTSSLRASTQTMKPIGRAT